MNRIPLGDNARCDRAIRNWRDQQVPEDDEEDLTQEEIEDFENEGGIIQ
jgi:hypothetical protein